MVKKSPEKERKYIIVTGGPVSGLGKGTAAASIGKILSANYNVVPIKYDGYLNADPDTQNPKEHGEVYILDDGRVADMDFGHYERFIGVSCKKEWSIVMGSTLAEMHEKERNGEYQGQTIRYIPHVTDYLQQKIMGIGEKENADIVIVEIGGVPSQFEALPGIEAVRRLKEKVGSSNILYAHLTQIVYLKCTQEQKTGTAQKDLKELRELGIVPDILILRCDTSEMPLDDEKNSKKKKIADASEINIESMIEAPDTKTIYEIPGNFYHGGLFDMIDDKLLNNKNKVSKQRRLESKRLDEKMKEWELLVNKVQNPQNGSVKIAICGKYTELKDSYASVREALTHAAANLDVKSEILWVDSKVIDHNPEKYLAGVDGLIVPGGYGNTGIEGMIQAIEYAREKNMPYMGLCLGLQLAVVEFARNVCKLEFAHSTEFNRGTKHPVINLIDSQKSEQKMGGTQRAGAQTAILTQGTLVQKLYKNDECTERHRHRWEVNPEYHQALIQGGLLLSGMSPDGKLVEFIELPSHPFFVASQAHNELKSRLETPNPLFYGFVEAALKHRKA